LSRHRRADQVGDRRHRPGPETAQISAGPERTSSQELRGPGGTSQGDFRQGRGRARQDRQAGGAVASDPNVAVHGPGGTCRCGRHQLRDGERAAPPGHLAAGREEVAAMSMNNLGKLMVLLHLALSMLALTWAASIFLQFTDWGWKEPRK